MIDWSKLEWPTEYPKPILVVPDNMAEAFRKAYPYADVIPVSTTLLPVTVSET